MNDFYSFDESSIPYWIRILFWGIYMVVFIYTVWKTQLSATKNKQRKGVTFLLGVFFALYAVFYCINPDYFRYREWLNVTDIDLWGKEEFYIYTVLFCRMLPFDYPFEVFRLIVWGGAVLMAWFTFRRYRQILLPGLTLLFLFVFYSSTFCYARASLAMAIYFFGVSLLLHSSKVIIKVLGLALAVSSVAFHQEMLIGIALLPSLLIPFEKKSTLFLSVIILITAIIAISYVNTHLQIFDTMLEDDELSSKIEEFNDDEQGAFRLSTLVKYLNYFYPFFVITLCFWKRKAVSSIAGIYRITYAIIMASVAFMVVFGLRSVFVYRVLYIAMIPLALLIGYGYCNGYFKKRQFLIMMILTLLSNSIRFVNA